MPANGHLCRWTDEAIAELHRNAGAQFDPTVVPALLEALAAPGACERIPRVALRPTFEPRVSTIASLRGLLEVTRLVRRVGSLDSVLDAIACTISDSLGLDTVVINLRRRSTDLFDGTTAHGSDGVRDAFLGTANSLDGWKPLLHERFHRRGAHTAAPANTTGRHLETTESWSGSPTVTIRGSGTDVLVAMAEHAAVAVESLQTTAGERPRLAPVQPAAHAV